MAISGEIALVLAKNYTNITQSTIQGTSYDYNTGELTFNTTDGDWVVPVNSGMTPAYKNTLDNIRYDNNTEKLEINGAEVLTKADAVGDDDNLNFDGWFD